MARCPCMAAMFMFLCNSLSTTSGATKPCRPQTTVDLRNTQFLHYKGRCAVAFRNKRSWAESRDFCRKGGGELIKFSSQEDVDTLGTSALGYGCYWIGLNDRQTEGERVWLDGTGTDLDHMFTVDGPTIFDDGLDCFSFCRIKNADEWLWHMQNCGFRLRLLCEFEMVTETTHTPTTMANKNVVTTFAQSDFTTLGSPPEKNTGKVNSIEANGKDLAHHRRQRVFRKENALGDHPYLLAVATETFTSWSAVQCCSRCMMTGGCHVINFNDKLHICRLFTTKQALQDGAQDIPDWIIFLSG